MPCSCCARDEPPPVPIAPMRVILRWKRDEKVRSIDGEIVFVDADLEIPMWSRMVYRTELFGRTCIRRRRRWVLRLHRRPARRGCDVGDWSARVGADAEGGRGEILKKAPRVVKRGERAGVSGAHRLEARHRPRRHVAQFVSRRRSDALDRQTWISEGQARCAVAPATSDSFFEPPQTGSRPESPRDPRRFVPCRLVRRAPLVTGHKRARDRGPPHVTAHPHAR